MMLCSSANELPRITGWSDKYCWSMCNGAISLAGASLRGLAKQFPIHRVTAVARRTLGLAGVAVTAS